MLYKGSGLLSTPSPGSRPERVRMKSSVSISMRSPATPWVNLPPAGPSKTSSNAWSWIRGPLRDNVGDEAAVVIGREAHRTSDGRVDVDPVGPHVAGEPDVEQVFEWRPSDRRPEWKGDVTGRRRGSPPAFDCLRSYRGDLTTISSLESWSRSRICNSFMPSTQWCESISLLSGMPRLNWWANSRTDA